MHPRSRWLNSTGKRCFDAIVAGALTTVTLPVAGAVAMSVRWKLGRPVFFTQNRAGRDGVPIGIRKFRSMTDERDSTGALLPDEQRLHNFGRALRSTSLDELPQLWSIMRGDMSLIGPRPLPLAYVERYSDEQRRRLSARPGLTGWAQVNGRNTLDWPERLAADVWYVDNASLRLDLTILWKTAVTVLRRSGVAADGQATMQEFIGET